MRRPHTIRIYDKVFASCFPRLRNHFQFLLRRGVTGQAVHIVIENDRELLIVTIRAAYPPPVFGQCSHSAIHACGFYTDAGRNRNKGLARHQLLPPVVMQLIRTAKLQIILPS